jgi:hypothetical protein
MTRERQLPSGLLRVLAVLVLAGCACRPATIVVAQKDEIVRLEPRPGPIETTGAGRLEESVQPVLKREYWVRTPDGQWHRIARGQYQSAEIGQSLEVCE